MGMVGGLGKVGELTFQPRTVELQDPFPAGGMSVESPLLGAQRLLLTLSWYD